MSEISVTVVGSTTINPTVGNGDTVNVTIASTGDRGPAGATGPTGPANTLAIGAVASGSTAAATITGSAPNQTLNLTLPKGDTGDTGPQGPAGQAGAQGIQGIPGVAGAAGAKGDTGDTGPQGPAGSIVEAATASGFPATGASQTLYVAIDVSRVYRWSGSVYVEIGPE